MNSEPPNVYRTNLHLEQKSARLSCFFVPTAALIFLPFIRGYAGFFINLELPSQFNYLEHLFDFSNVVMAIMSSVFPLIWLACIKLEIRFETEEDKKIPYAAIIATICILGASILFKHERIQWFFLEAGKARFEKYSFPRSIVYGSGRIWILSGKRRNSNSCFLAPAP